ncbi:hypothetical protein [Reichenbachiella ulvae]|uniref:Lipoprotein n=1 Tax=Reichenbachiella ulvae TaxID=2980104 RepID=A0ABT3CPZ3_9BACT|nr:hypothetical protein [Reichenbachiella ulvae]MCV9385788.1 hypothetical protein [Reichenbachiella ulvae]
MNLVAKLFLAFVIILQGCVMSKDLVLDAVWEKDNYEPLKYRKVIVFGFSENMEKNKKFEINAVKALKNEGVLATPGHEVYDFSQEGRVNPHHLKNYLFSQGFDGILTASVIDNISKDNEEISDQELEKYSEGIYKFDQFYQNRYSEISNDTPSSNKVLEANFFYIMDQNDFDGSGLVWISHFQIKDELEANFPVEDYSKRIVKSLFEDQVIVKK